MTNNIDELQQELAALRDFVRSQISFETGFLYGSYTRDSGFCIYRESVGDIIATGKDCLEAWENLLKNNIGG